MNFQYICSIWKLNVYFVSTILFGKSNSFVLTDLFTVCVFSFPFDTLHLPISSTVPPNHFCTAFSTYLQDNGRPPRPEFDKNAINALKGKRPFVFIYDTYDIEGLKKKVSPKNVQNFISELNNEISGYSADVLILDFMFVKDEELQIYDENFQNNLKSCFSELKKIHTKMLFGLLIHRNAELVKSVLNVQIIDTSIDLYVIRSYFYDKCTYRKHQNKMAPNSDDKLMEKTIIDLKNTGYNATKLFPIIKVGIRSFKNSDDDYGEGWSNKWMCTASSAGRKRKYCRGTLDSLYLQSKLVFNHKLSGAFVDAVDRDDYVGDCLCGPFPAARVISDGIKGLDPNLTLTRCRTFGLLPRERKHVK